MWKLLNDLLSSPPRRRDMVILSVFTVLITIHPYYLNDRINVFELGLYLPGINAILHGMVPYRDFIHLRGPLELYVPAWLMGPFGTRMEVLCAYFFFGNVLCLIFVVFIAKEVLRSRFMLYLMVPVVIARTYPRVVFMIWGGMRYALGLAAVFCFIKFLKTRKRVWVFVSGVITAGASLISIEMGCYVFLAAAVCLLLTRKFKELAVFLSGAVLGVLPWVVYSISQGAFVAYLDNVWTIVTRMQAVLDPHLVSQYPKNFPEALAAMANTHHVNFKHLTPAYTYVFVLVYLGICIFKKKWDEQQHVLLFLGIFGFIMYNTAFRGLWASQFEMALMPEKIIYFFLGELVMLWAWQKSKAQPKAVQTAIVCAIAGIFIMSWAYSVVRYNKRFWAFQYVVAKMSGKDTGYLQYRDKHEQYAKLGLERAQGIMVPVDQAKDLSEINDFIRTHTGPEDVVLMFPEMGTYNFLFDRPFLGRFPIPTFSWFGDQWFKEYMPQFSSGEAKYMIVQKEMPKDWYQVYLGHAPNKIKYDQMLGVIKTDYILKTQTPSYWIYQRRP